MENVDSPSQQQNVASPPNQHTLVTAGGGLAVESPSQEMLPSGLPANKLNYTYSGDAVNKQHLEAKEEGLNEPGLDKRVVAASVAALPRYASAQDVAKANEPERKVAKALFDYPGGYRSNELTFHRGTSLIITKEKEGWVYGHYELEPSLTGWFPKSYVKIITGTT